MNSLTLKCHNSFQNWNNRKSTRIDILYTVNQSTFHEICNVAIWINIKAFNRVNRKELNILKTLSEFQEFYFVAYCRWFSHESCLTIFFRRIVVCEQWIVVWLLTKKSTVLESFMIQHVQFFTEYIVDKFTSQVNLFIKKKTLPQVFSCEFSEISKNTFLMEHFRETAS